MLPELLKDMFIKVTDVHEHDTVMQRRTSCTSQFTEQCVARNLLSMLVLELGIISCKM